MNISVVIPNYNGEKILQKNLPEVVRVVIDHLNKSHDLAEIIVVDDGSSDDSISVIKNIFANYNKDIRLLLKLEEHEKNQGFSSTVNRGVRHAEGDVVVLLNSDVRPDIGFLKPLVSHFSDEKIFAVGCMDKSIEDGKVVLRGRGVGQWRRGFLVHSAGSLDKTNTLWVNGGSGAFRRSMWSKLGGLCELYNPFYWEDIDISYRAQKAGYTLLFEKDSTVTHEHEEGAIKTSRSQSTITTTAYRNQIFFVWLNADSSTLLSHVCCLPYHCLKALLRLDKSFFAGLFAAIIQLPAVLNRRKKIQRHSVISDKQVTKDISQ